VVIPVYNEERYLAMCLESMLDQEIKADEIIIVDNNSTDDSIKIAKRYPVIVVREKEQGITPTRNRGFNEAHFEIIARTDADTKVPHDWIKKIKKHFTDKDVVAVSGPTNFYDLPKQFSSKAALNVHRTYFRLMKQILKHDSIFGPNMAIRKDAWEKIKDEVCVDDEKVHEDIDLAMHISPYGKIVFDRTLEVSSSFRRFKTLDMLDSYVEYPYRVMTSIQKHKSFSVRKNGKRLVKKFATKVFPRDLQY
jgi:glycosyltransferase involved in cell wall biosynthesis